MVRRSEPTPNILEALHRAHARGEALPQRLTIADQQRLLTEKPRQRGNRKGAFPTEPYPWSPPGRTLHLTLPGYLPPSLNEYSRRQSVRRTAVPEAVEQIGLALMVARSKWQTEQRSFYRAKLEVRLWFATKRRRDARTNWSKVVEDALVEAGLLVDDSLPWCVTSVETDCDPANPRTEITLVEVER